MHRLSGTHCFVSSGSAMLNAYATHSPVRQPRKIYEIDDCTAFGPCSTRGTQEDSTASYLIISSHRAAKEWQLPG